MEMSTRIEQTVPKVSYPTLVENVITAKDTNQPAPTSSVPQQMNVNGDANKRHANTTEKCQYCINLRRALAARLRRQATKCSVKYVNVKNLTYGAISKKLRNASRRQSRLSLKLALERVKVQVISLTKKTHS